MPNWGRFALAAATILTTLIGATSPARALEGSWSALGAGLQYPVHDVAVSDSGVMYASEQVPNGGGYRVSKWSGSVWETILEAGGKITTLVVDRSERPIVGGAFTFDGSNTTHYVAMLTDGGWVPMDSGLDSTVSALAVDSSNTLYAAGGFTSKVAQWIPTGNPGTGQWAALGSLSANINSLAIVGSTLYALGSQMPSRVAEYTNNGWTGLGAPERIYGITSGAGGLFGFGAGVVTQWSGEAWSDVGGYMRHDVDAFAVPSRGLYFAAGSEVAGGLQTSSGSSWQIPNGGLTGGAGTGLALAVTPSGGVLVGGSFTAAAGVSASNIALWTPPAPSNPAAVTADFTYLMPDGGECTAVSPAKVTVGTSVSLPTFIPCQGSSELVGWRIPGQDWAFAPGRSVGVVDSQKFTAVIREPNITVEYDANVGARDACIAGGIDVGLEHRTQAARVARASLTSVPFASQAPCQPTGVRLVGWSDRPTTNGSDRVGPGGTAYLPGAALPTSWTDGGTEPVNRIRLYAMWAAA